MKSHPVIVNIINFIRACEPRDPVDLHGTVLRQADVPRRHNLSCNCKDQWGAAGIRVGVHGEGTP